MLQNRIMQTVTQNNQKKRSVTPHFYKGVPAITGYVSVDHLPFVLKDFTDMCMEAVYVLDFVNRGFQYVANRVFFLCGHSAEDAMSLGYDFFPKVIHSKDLALLENIHSAILKRLCSMDRPDEINYFSFSVRIRSEAGYQMVDHKFKPIFVNGQIRFGLCLMASSVLNVSGNLRAYYYNRLNFDEYSLKNGQWFIKTIEPLTLQEKKVLILAKQGEIGKRIADKICVEPQTVKNIKNTIYRKLHVNTITQAINVATSHHLIFQPIPLSKRQEKEKIVTITKQRRQMTREKRERIQEELDEGKSVNSIATQMGVSECTIRYAIKTGRIIREFSRKSQFDS